MSKRSTVADPPIVIEQDGTPSTSAAIMPAKSPLEIYQTLAANPGADLSQLKALLDLQREYRSDQARQAAAVAMNRVQAECQEVLKDSVNAHTGSRFAQLESIHRIIKPVYTKHGFGITFSEAECPKEGHMRIAADLIHAEGHTRRYTLDLPYDGKGSQGGNSAMNPLQGRGSTITYGRRYLESMIWNLTIAGEDIDGNSPLNAITAEQIVEITNTFKTARACNPVITWDGFLKWLTVSSIDKCTQADFAAGMADLKSKIAAAAAKAASSAK